MDGYLALGRREVMGVGLGGDLGVDPERFIITRCRLMASRGAGPCSRNAGSSAMAARGRRNVADGDDAVDHIDTRSALVTWYDGLYWDYFAGVVMSWKVGGGHGQYCA